MRCFAVWRSDKWEKTKVDEKTTNAFYIIQGNEATDNELLLATARKILDETIKYCGGKKRQDNHSYSKMKKTQKTGCRISSSQPVLNRSGINMMRQREALS